MAIANYFYHKLTRKYVALFGSTFNKLSLARYDNNGVIVQRMPIPISFSPWQKFLNKITQDPTQNNQTSAILPMITFELNNISYDTLRKIHSQQILQSELDEKNVLTPVPYLLHFTLNIWTSNVEDSAQIVEQIVPYFQPDYTRSVYLIDGFQAIDIPLTLEAVSYEDLYEGNYNGKRVIRWYLNFTMSGFYFGPVRESKKIKFVDVGIKSTKTSAINQSLTQVELNADGMPIESNIINDVGITVQPGMDVNGNPTNDINLTIPYQEINENDNWESIIVIEHNT